MNMHTLSSRIIHWFILLALLAGCSSPIPSPSEPTAVDSESSSTPLPPEPETLVSFRVAAPANTPDGTQVFLTILDEVTGLALNSIAIPMEPGAGAPGSSGGPVYVMTLPFRIGSVIKYRYERSSSLGVNVAEHLSDGSAVRYRMVHVTGQILVDDVVGCWTDTAFELPTGRVSGRAVNAADGKGIPSLLIAAGGAQTITTADGAFLLEGLPPGVHNLVAYAMDGAFKTFQQGARIAADATTPADLQMQAAVMTKVVLVVSVPEGTPPVIPVQLAGNLYSLGNTFANLSMGASVLPGNMPRMEPLPDGRYRVTISLPIGADIRYKYTLGDGFWNAERNVDGSIRLRQLIVPESTVLIEDLVETWQDSAASALTIDLRTPASTPTDDFISVQFNPLIGWTEPIPMWNLGSGRWGYVLYGPLNLPGDLSYRFCRNGQCDTAADSAGERKVKLTGEPQTVSVQVDSWQDWGGETTSEPPTIDAPARGADFIAGVEISPNYHPSWESLFPSSIHNITALNANLVVFTPTWSYGRTPPGIDPPLLSSQPESDPSWFALQEMIAQAEQTGNATAIYPTANFLIPWDQWWAAAPRDDPGWWPVWFEQYNAFILHHADLATASGAEALILGGDWLSPALPGGTLADGQPSGVPEDAEARWRGLLDDIRTRFDGQVLWAATPYSLEKPPVFLDAFDELYITMSLLSGQDYSMLLGMELEAWLDGVLAPQLTNAGKSAQLALELPSSPDMQFQSDSYAVALQAAAGREWITGVISQGYYPPVAVQDDSPSIHGKLAEDLISAWYSALLGP